MYGLYSLSQVIELLTMMGSAARTDFRHAYEQDLARRLLRKRYKVNEKVN